MNTNKADEYAIAVADSILSLFRDEEYGGNINFHYDLTQIDATEFFTGMIMGCNLVFNKLTGEKMNMLDFTNLVIKLIVQHLLGEKENENERN